MEAAPPRDPCAARDLGRRGSRLAFPNEGQHRLDDGFARALAACLAAVQLGLWGKLLFHRRTDITNCTSSADTICPPSESKCCSAVGAPAHAANALLDLVQRQAKSQQRNIDGDRALVGILEGAL